MKKLHSILNNKKYLQSVLLSATTILIFVVTRLPHMQTLILLLTGIMLVILISYIYIARQMKRKKTLSFVYLIILTTLLLVFSTGWYVSPFFFLLYLLSISFTFLFPPLVTRTFVLTLSILLLLTIGQVDIWYDLFIVLSILVIIPLYHYLQKEYLLIKEQTK